jgi:hypothetical protein
MRFFKKLSEMLWVSTVLLFPLASFFIHSKQIDSMHELLRKNEKKLHQDYVLPLKDCKFGDYVDLFNPLNFK